VNTRTQLKKAVGCATANIPTQILSMTEREIKFQKYISEIFATGVDHDFD